MSETCGPHPPPERQGPGTESGPIEATLVSIAAHFDRVMADRDAVEADCAKLRAQLGAPGSVAFDAALRRLTPLLRQRAGPIAEPVYALLADGLAASPDPWALVEGMFAARETDLVRRTLELVVEHVTRGRIAFGQQALLVLSRAADAEDSPLAAPDALARMALLIGRLPATRPRRRDVVTELFLARADARVRRLAARILDRGGETPSPALVRRLLGADAQRFLAPYLEYTRASHQDLLELVAEPDALARLVAALRRARAVSDDALLREVIATLGWKRLNLGLEVEPLVTLSAGGSFPLVVSPAEAALLESTRSTQRTGVFTLFIAHGGRRAGDGLAAGDLDAVSRFRSYNLLHAEALGDILDLTPLTRDKVARILDRTDRLVGDFTALFAAHSEEAAALPEAYASLRAQVVKELEGHPGDTSLSAELTRLVQMFEDPPSLSRVHTLHGLKRYLHQQGLRLGMRFVEGGGTTDRTVDVVLAAGKKILRSTGSIHYVDFEADAATTHGAVPFAVETLARQFARQLVAGCEKLPNVKIFCYGNEVHYYLAFANHPVFLRIDYSPPLLGGMVDLEFYGVSKYELDAHPNPRLEALGVLFRRLEFDFTAEHTHVHARFDKERSLDLATLCDKAEVVLRLAPWFMDLDWVIGQLELPEDGRRRVAEAWADFFDAWGVLPMAQVLSHDRLGIVVAIEQGPSGEREVLWSGDGPYQDRFSAAAPADFLAASRRMLQSLGLGAESGIASRCFGQLEFERLVLQPLRDARARRQVVLTDGGFEPAVAGWFEVEHEAEVFAAILSKGGEPLSAAAQVAALVAPLERTLRLHTTGAVQGCAVQRAPLARPGDGIELYVLRGAAGMIRLAFYTRDRALWRRRAHPKAGWESNRSTDAGELTALLRTARYLTPSMETVAPLADPEALRTRLERTAARRRRPLGGERIVSGLRASPGTAVGKVVLGTAGRVPSEFDAAILVAPAVRPEDNTSIYHAAGVVSTGGGVLSHAGLIAMQFHKPALVVQGRWERERDGAACLVYRTTEFAEEEKNLYGFRVTLRRDVREREHRLHDGDLVVLDADEGALHVLGGDRDALGLHEGFRMLRAAGDRLAHASEVHDVLVQRGARLRARHQIEKLLGRLDDPVLARYAAEEILVRGSFAAGGERTAESATLLAFLLRNPHVGEATRGFLDETASELVRRDAAAFEKARRDIPTSASLAEILSLRLDALQARAALEGGIAALHASGMQVSSPELADTADVDAIASTRLRALRDACVTSMDALVDDPRVRHQLRAVERFGIVLGAAAAMEPRLRALGHRLAAADEAARKRLGERSILAAAECGYEVASIVGWKAAHLAEIERLGGPGTTPPWFVVTHRAFEQMLASPVARTRSGVEALVPQARSLGEAIETLVARADLDGARKSACIRELWRETPLVPGLAAELEDAYHSLGGAASGSAPPHVAVRSSTREEDAEIAARAGEFETFLFIRGHQALCDTLRRAWSGLWTERAIHNRAVLGSGGAQLGGGVVVQRIVWSRVSGVLQTVNVAERNLREIVVNAGLGLGEGVVSGLVGADQIVVAKEGDLLNSPLRFRYVTGDKREQVVFDARAGTGTVRSECLYHQRFRPALEYVELCELVRTATRLESAYGHPLDIEFGIEANRLWILQARPVPILLAMLSETAGRQPFRREIQGGRRPLQGVAHDPA